MRSYHGVIFKLYFENEYRFACACGQQLKGVLDDLVD